MTEVCAATYHLVCLGSVPELPLGDGVSLPVAEQPNTVSWGDRVVHVHRLPAEACSVPQRSALVTTLAAYTKAAGPNSRWLFVFDWQNLDWFLAEPTAWPAMARPLVASGKRPAEALVLASLAAGLDGYIPQAVHAMDLGRLVKQLFRT